MSEFWDWAVKAYGGEGISAQFLALQNDHDQCVPYLLWAVWTGVSGAPLTADLAEEGADIARSWSESVIKPVRILRKRLKLPLSDIDDAARERLRLKVKALELESERELMRALEGLSIIYFSNEKQDVTGVCRDHVLTCAKAWHDKVPRVALFSLVEGLSEGGFLEYKKSS